MEYVQAFGNVSVVEYTRINHRYFLYNYDAVNRLETDIRVFIKVDGASNAASFLSGLMESLAASLEKLRMEYKDGLYSNSIVAKVTALSIKILPRSTSRKIL